MKIGFFFSFFFGKENYRKRSPSQHTGVKRGGRKKKGDDLTDDDNEEGEGEGGREKRGARSEKEKRREETKKISRGFQPHGLSRSSHQIFTIVI